MPFLSLGKLKISYGTTGNDQIGNYQYLSLYSQFGQLPYQGIPTIVPGGLTNPYLQWEETKKAEAGLDLGFLRDRIIISSIYVRNRSSNELLNYTLPAITGFTGVARNFPANVQNAEWEFAFNSVNIKTSVFSWSSHINLTIPKNKLLSFPNLSSSSYASDLKIGRPVGGFYGFHFLGVNDTTGVYQFADSKGNPTSNPQYGTDNNLYISVTPKFYGGFENNFNYKGIGLDVLFQFVKQIGSNYAFGNNPGSFGSGNQPVWVLNRWQKSGDHAGIQRYNTNNSYFTQYYYAAYFSDAAYSDASYIRLKNLALSWQLPLNKRSKTLLQVCKVYLQGQNLLTITHYRGMDPESPTGSSVALPPLKILTAGVQATF